VKLVKYEVHTKDHHQQFDPRISTPEMIKQLELNFIIEGQFFNGSLDGYGRKFYRNREFQVGYWKNSLPYGKFSRYLYGKLDADQEGLWNDWGDAPYLAVAPKKIASYTTNEEPPLRQRAEVKEVEDTGPVEIDFAGGGGSIPAAERTEGTEDAAELAADEAAAEAE